MALWTEYWTDFLGRGTVEARSGRAHVERGGRGAHPDHDVAISAGKRVSIAEEVRSSVFAMRVGNIMPGEHVTVRLTLAGELIYEDGARPSASRSWSCPAISPALRSPAGRSATGSRPTPGRTSSAR